MQSSAPPSSQQDGIRNKIDETRNTIDDARNKVKDAAFFFVPPLEFLAQRVWGNTEFDQVTEKEMVAAFVYKMVMPWLQENELRVEIRRGNALWVIGQGDETIKVKLRRNHKMRLSRATASMSADGMLTIEFPKRFRPRKWYEYKDLAFNMFKTVPVGISWSQRSVITLRVLELSM